VQGEQAWVWEERGRRKDRASHQGRAEYFDDWREEDRERIQRGGGARLLVQAGEAQSVPETEKREKMSISETSGKREHGAVKTRTEKETGRKAGPYVRQGGRGENRGKISFHDFL